MEENIEKNIGQPINKTIVVLGLILVVVLAFFAMYLIFGLFGEKEIDNSLTPEQVNAQAKPFLLSNNNLSIVKESDFEKDYLIGEEEQLVDGVKMVLAKSFQGTVAKFVDRVRDEGWFTVEIYENTNQAFEFLMENPNNDKKMAVRIFQINIGTTTVSILNL